MKYEEDLNKPDFILDERNFINAMALIEDIIEKDLNIKLNNDEDIISFLDDPGTFTKNEEVVDSVKDLKELLEIMGGTSHV